MNRNSCLIVGIIFFIMNMFEHDSTLLLGGVILFCSAGIIDAIKGENHEKVNRCRT